MSKKYDSENITCSHCYNFSKMEVFGTVEDKVDEWEDDHGPGISVYDIYEFLRCPKCKGLTIRSYYWNDLMDGEDVVVNYNHIYPEDKKVPLGLPSDILNAYLAAEKVKHIDANAYAMLLRRLLEGVCIDRGEKPGQLASMLQKLANKNEIPQNLVQVATGLKNFGNIGAHAGLGNISEEEVPILKALTDAILEYVYSAPHLGTLAANKLQEIKNIK